MAKRGVREIRHSQPTSYTGQTEVPATEPAYLRAINDVAEVTWNNNHLSISDYFANKVISPDSDWLQSGSTGLLQGRVVVATLTPRLRQLYYCAYDDVCVCHANVSLSAHHGRARHRQQRRL